MTTFKPQKHIAKLISKQEIAENILEYTFEAHGGNFNFIAGQYITIFIGGRTRRQYSISSSPYELPKFQIIFDTRPNGPGTHYLLGLNQLDSIEFLGPIGNFILPDNLSKHLTFIATGTGISPLKSMLEDAISRDVKSTIYLYFGTRYEREVVYPEFFHTLEKTGKIKKYKICLSREKIEGLDIGRVTQYIDDFYTDNNDFFLCGSGDMINSVENLLLSLGVKPAQIHYEKFY